MPWNDLKQGDKIEVKWDGEWRKAVFLYGPALEPLAANEDGGEMWGTGDFAVLCMNLVRVGSRALAQ